MSVDIVDMLHQDGVENAPGFATMHGIALMADFVAGTGLKKAASLSDQAATAITVGSIATPHVFKQGKCMKKVYSTENKGEAKDDVVGDTDSQAGKWSFTWMVPGVKAEYHATRKLYNSSKGVAFATLADGQVMQYGSELFPANFKVTWGSGNNEGYRGYTINAWGYGDGVLYTPGLNFTPAV